MVGQTGGSAKSASKKASGARFREWEASDWTELGDFLRGYLSGTTIRPKYEALRHALAEAMNRNLIASGALLPTEKELTEIVPYGLATVQRSLKALSESGLISRKPGVGTVVVPLKWQIRQPLHVNLQDNNSAQAPLTSKVLSRKQAKSKGRWQAHLIDAKQPVVIRRLHLAAGSVPVYSEYYVDGAAYPQFLEKPLSELRNENLRHIFSRELGIVVAKITTRISAAPVPKSIASELSIKPGTTCLLQRATASSNQNVLYYAEFWIPPNPYELVIESNL